MRVKISSFASFHIMTRRKIITSLVLAFMFSVQAGTHAQKPNSYYTYWPKYYEFRQDIQMVEIVFGIADVQEAFRYSRMNSAMPVPDPNPPVYIFRDRQGKILKVYNLCGTPVDSYKILPPTEVKTKDLNKHRVTRYPIVENCGTYGRVSMRLFDIYKHANANLELARWGVVDQLGTMLVFPQYEKLSVVTDQNYMLAMSKGKWGILDENGKHVQPFVFDELECWSYDGGMFLGKRKNKYSYFNSTGQQISTREYDFGEIFWSRRALVAINGKYGFIDSTGTEVVPLIYKNATSFYYNVAVVGDGKKYGMINNQGQVIQPLEYDRITDDYDEKMMVVVGYFGMKDGKQYHFNREGKLTGVKNP